MGWKGVSSPVPLGRHSTTASCVCCRDSTQVVQQAVTGCSCPSCYFEIGGCQAGMRRLRRCRPLRTVSRLIAAMKSVPCCCIRTRGGFLTFPAQYQLLYSPGMAHLASSAESGGEQAPQRSAALIPTINPFQGQITQQTGPGCAHTNLDGPRQSSRPSATPPNVPRQICCLACISSSKRTG